MGTNQLPLSSILPGVGQSIGVDLANEIKANSALPAASVGNGITGAQLAANTVGSGQLSLDTVQHVQVALSAADILALNATPKQLLAAPGAGKTIILHRILFTMVSTATQFANGGVVVAQYHTGGVAAINTIAAAVVTAAAGTTKTVREAIDVTAVANDILELTNATGAFITGTGTATVDVWYSIG